MTFALSVVSRSNLEGVHPDLVEVVERAIEITDVDFRVTDGVRTVEEQRKLMKAGATRTMNSNHLPQKDGWSHAVDLVALIDGRARWDWPLYFKLAAAMKKAAAELDVDLEWGGDWKTFKDGPHFQLGKRYRA